MDEILEYYRQATPWRTLEVGLRMDNTWNNAFRFLMQENMMEEDLFDAFTECIRNHAKVLMTIPPLLWPDANHHHYLSENLGLFYAAYMLRELPETEMWIKCAESALERCVQNQETEDVGMSRYSWQHTLQQVMMRTAWNKDALSVFFEGMISDVLDVTRPSTRLCLRDVSTEGKMRDYLTIVVPFKEETVSVSEVVFENGGKEAVFIVNDKVYRCHWENDTFEIL